VAVDLDSGYMTRALFGEREISEHPETGQPLTGVEIPYWDQILDA
jgi:hypothetical protein